MLTSLTIMSFIMLILGKKENKMMVPFTISVFVILHETTSNSFYSCSNTYVDWMSSTLISLNCWVSIFMFAAMLKKVMTIKLSNLNILTITLFFSISLSFMVNSTLSFYFLFEVTLIPTLVMILMWGYQPERLQAGNYFILYTLTASLPLLMNILNKVMLNHKFSFYSSPSNLSMWVSMSLMLAFLVKAPMYFSHLWLPKAHVEAPVAGSMLLAGTLLKLGTYGMIRFIFMAHNLSTSFKTLMSTVSLMGATITAILCTRQTDMKALIAYSSVAHMGLALVGILSNTLWGMNAAIILMIAHGFTSSMLFYLANSSYEMNNSRMIILNKGLIIMLPSSSMIWFLLVTPNMGTPPFINFFAEFMLITSSMSISLLLIIPLSILCFYNVLFNLYLYVTINHGNSPMFNTLTMSMSKTYLSYLLHFTPLLAMSLKLNLMAL